MSTPSLWARIEVGDAYELFDLYGLKSRLPYIAACIERSREALMDVDLNLRNRPDREEYLKTRFRRVALPHLEEDEVGPALSLIENHWCTSPSDQRPWPLSHERFQFLCGLDQSGIRRWRSLHLHIPFCDVEYEVWEILAGITRNLKTINLEKVPERWTAWREALDLKIVDLSGVESMVLEAAINPNEFSVSQALRHLKIHIDPQLQSIQDFSSFSQLQTLHLHRLALDTYEKDEPALRLPQLQNLIVDGQYDLLEGIVFDIPNLQKYTIYTSSYLFSPPNVSAPHIQWRSHKKPYVEDYNEIYWIRSLLMSSGHLITFTVPMEARALVLKTVSRSNVKEAILCIQVEDENGDIERIDAKDIEKML